MESRVIDSLLGKRFGLYGAAPSVDDVVTACEANAFCGWVFVANPVPEGLADRLAAKGVAFKHVPIEVPALCTLSTAENLHKALSSISGNVGIQCATANRASAALAVHYAMAEGLAPSAAFEWANSHGLKFMGTPALRAWLQVALTPLPTAHILGPGAPSGVILRQLFEKASSTYSYILGCPSTREAIIIDPVLETAGRDVEVANALGLRLTHALNTHVHADHVSGTTALKAKVPGLKSVIAAVSGAACDVPVKEGDVITFGARHVSVLATPGHTDGCLTYVLDDASMAFTGDALLIRGCGRTDFQQGSASRLWESIHTKVFTLPPSTVLYPGHDYNGHACTTVAEESALNPRLGIGRTQAEFEDIMAKLGLPKPAQIDRAVPANMKDGVE